LRTRTIEIKVSLGSIGNLGVGSYAETDWIVEKITFVGMDELGVTIICDCVHVEDYTSLNKEV
jgi:hypothetical protein